jgi:hypothetical protein
MTNRQKRKQIRQGDCSYIRQQTNKQTNSLNEQKYNSITTIILWCIGGGGGGGRRTRRAI